MSNVQARGASVQMCSIWRDSYRERLLDELQFGMNKDALYFASAELKADREVVLAAVQRSGDGAHDGRRGILTSILA